jgi:hypothetical protein
MLSLRAILKEKIEDNNRENKREQFKIEAPYAIFTADLCCQYRNSTDEK